MRRELCGNPGYSANHAGKISASVPPFLTWSCCAKQQGAFKDEEWLLHLSREMGKWTSDVTYSLIQHILDGRYFYVLCLKHFLNAR